MAEHLVPAAKRALAVLFVVAVPLLFIAVSVTWAINDLSLYEYGFDRYRVTSVTGIEKADLMAVAREIRNYFNSATEPLAVMTRVFGEERVLFNEKEVVHMHDVKKLVRGVYWVGAGSAIFIVAFIAVGFYLHRREFWRTLARLGLFGAGVTVGADSAGRTHVAGEFRLPVHAVPRAQLCQRLLAAGPKTRLPSDDVSLGGSGSTPPCWWWDWSCCRRR